ncbi:MAG: GGDEF domain-containing protein [Solirubrobacterales bacterium]
MDSSRLIRDGVDRDRMLDMDLRLVPVRRLSFAILAAALIASGPWIGWWTLVPLAVAGVLFALADRLIPSIRRPEYAIFAAWAASEAIIAASVAVTGGEGLAMLSWLGIPIVTLVARFSDRGIAVGTALAVVLLFGVAFGVDGAAVTANPTLIIAPLALILVVMTFSVALMRSDAEHRTRAVLDPLTSMLNRTALEGRSRELAEQSEITGEPVGMIVADLDNFKAINDTHGHGMGDAVLRNVAYVIRKQLRAFDLAYRIGGEEFLVLLPGAGEEECEAVAEKIRAAVEAEVTEGVTVTLSAGVAASKAGEAFDHAALFAACDAALYAAKREGRNRAFAGHGRPALTAA